MGLPTRMGELARETMALAGFLLTSEERAIYNAKKKKRRST
jgi:hypothetical protein